MGQVKVAASGPGQGLSPRITLGCQGGRARPSAAGWLCALEREGRVCGRHCRSTKREDVETRRQGPALSVGNRWGKALMVFGDLSHNSSLLSGEKPGLPAGLSWETEQAERGSRSMADRSCLEDSWVSRPPPPISGFTLFPPCSPKMFLHSLSHSFVGQG